MSTRHECRSRISPTCTRGNGQPKRKSCAYCGSAFTVLTGQWGVFVHSSFNGGDARYRAQDAVRVFERESAADRFTEQDKRYVVRWLDT